MAALNAASMAAMISFFTGVLLCSTTPFTIRQLGLPRQSGRLLMSVGITPGYSVHVRSDGNGARPCDARSDSACVGRAGERRRAAAHARRAAETVRAGS
jgi:hypothetical protein